MEASRRLFLSLLGAAGFKALASRAASVPSSSGSAPIRLSKNKLSDAWPKTLPAQTGLGPAATVAYSASFYAPDRKEWYRLAEGGHNTGLNFVSKFSEVTGLYSLVAEPAPLCTGPDDDVIVGLNPDGTARTVKVSTLAPNPVNGWPLSSGSHTWLHPKWGPVSGHNYGVNVAYSGRKFYRLVQPENWPVNSGVGKGEFWRFDPDEAEKPNHGWTKLGNLPVGLTPNNVGGAFWESAPGKLTFLTNTYGLPGFVDGKAYAEYDIATDTWRPINKLTSDKYGVVVGRYDPADDTIYMHGFDVFAKAKIGAPSSYSRIALRAMHYWHDHPFIPYGDWLWTWNPTDGMLRLHKTTGQWQMLSSVKPPFKPYIYTAVRAENGAFIADCVELGVWSFPIPADDAGWVDVPAVSAIPAQHYIDKAAAGSDVTIPPGYYTDGLVISKSLNVHLKDVALLGTVQGKANIVVTIPDKVRIYDHRSTGAGTDRTGAAIRDNGNAVDLELYNVHYSGCPNGVMIGNVSASKLLIDGGVIEKMTGDGFSHGIYFGRGDTITLRNLTIRGDGVPATFGHLLKSRAKTTIVEDTCKLLGGTGTYSRLVDLPCGGVATLAGTYQHSANAENPDMFSYAVEKGPNCLDDQGVQRCDVPGSFTFTGTLTTDRAVSNFGLYRGAAGTKVTIDKTGLPAGLPLGTFPDRPH